MLETVDAQVTAVAGAGIVAIVVALFVTWLLTK